MKEEIDNYQDKKKLWRKVTAMAGIFLALTACEKPKITDGTIYQKEHIETTYGFTPKAVFTHQEIERESDSIPPFHEENGVDKETISKFLLQQRLENWKVYIAQCPKRELPPQDNIEKDCKTNSFDVSQEVFNNIQIGQYADFQQQK